MTQWTSEGTSTGGSASTREQLRAKVRLNVQSRTDLDSQIDAALNNACEELSRMAWRELVARSASTSTTADTQYVSLPVDLEELLAVQFVNDTQSYAPALWTKAEAEGRYPVADAFASGPPAGCYREGSLLYFVPVPDDDLVVRVHYRAMLTLGSGAGDAVSSAGFDSLLVAFATAEVFESLEHAKDTAGRWWGIFRSRTAQKRSSQWVTGEVRKVDTRLSADVDPRRGNPEVVWWREGRL